MKDSPCICAYQQGKLMWKFINEMNIFKPKHMDLNTLTVYLL